MSFGATGSFLFSDSSALTVNNQGTGNLLLIEVLNYTNKTVDCTGLSGGKATWTQIGTAFRGTSNAWSASLFMGTTTATGTATLTPTWSGTAPGGYEINGHEFTSTVGSWSADTTGTIDSPGGTANFASLTPGSSGELYFGFAGSSASSAGTTSGYVYNVNGDGDATCYNLSCPSGTATFPVWGSADELMGIMALLKEGSSGVSGAAALSGAGSLVTGSTLGAIATLSGAGSLSTAVRVSAIATLGGAGSLATASRQSAPATMGAAGSLSTSSAQQAGTTLAGAASVSAPVSTTVSKATLGGAGSLSASAAGQVSGAAALGAAGSLAAASAQQAGAALGAAGSLASAPSQQAPATLAGAGSVTALETLRSVVTLAGTGAVATALRLSAVAALNGTGSLSASTAAAGIAFRAANVPGLSTASTIVATVPLAVQAGDSILMYVTNYGVASNAITAASDGTTQPVQIDQRAGGNGVSTHTLWWFTAASGDAGAHVTFTQGTATYIGCVLLSYSGANTHVQPDVFTHGDTNGGNVTPWVAPTAVTATDGAWGIFFATGVGGGGDETTSYDGGTARAQDSTTGLSGYDSNGPAGLAGTTIGGGNWTAVAGSESWYGYTVGLRAAITTQGAVTLGGAGSLSPALTLSAPAVLGAAGSLSQAGTTGSKAALAAAGSLAAAATGSAPAALGGAGSLSTVLRQGATAALGGAGSLSTVLRQGATAALGGAGSLSTAGTQRAVTTLAGAGSIATTAPLGHTGPFNIILPGGWARITSGAFSVVLPAPAMALTGFPGTLTVLAGVLPAPHMALAGKVSHNPLNLTLPRPHMTLAATVVHSAFSIRLPAPHMAVTGLRAHAGAFAIPLGRARGPLQHVARRTEPVPAGGKGGDAAGVGKPGQSGTVTKVRRGAAEIS